MDLSKLFAAIIADYKAYSTKTDGTISAYAQEQIAEMESGKTLYAMESGKKYMRIVRATSAQQIVWGFVVIDHNDKRYPYGTLLKAAGWKAPALNGARGNVIDEDFSWVKWTGLAYK